MFGLKADRQQGGAAQDAKSSQGGPYNGSSEGHPATEANGFRSISAQYGTDGWSKNDAVTIISEDIVINGNISAQRPVCLEGTVEGDLKGDQVIIGKAGAVTGSIVANAVEVHGRVLGSIQSKSVMLYKTAHVEGDIVHQGIGIEMGTHYDGRLKWDGGQDAKISQFDPAYAAPKPVAATGQPDRFNSQAEPRGMAVAFNAEATSPQY